MARQQDQPNAAVEALVKKSEQPRIHGAAKDQRIVQVYIGRPVDQVVLIPVDKRPVEGDLPAVLENADGHSPMLIKAEQRKIDAGYAVERHGCPRYAALTSSSFNCPSRSRLSWKNHAPCMGRRSEMARA